MWKNDDLRLFTSFTDNYWKNSESLLLFAREARVHPYPLLQLEQGRCLLTNNTTILALTCNQRTFKRRSGHTCIFLTVKFTTKLLFNWVCYGNITKIKRAHWPETYTPATLIPNPLSFHFLLIFYDISHLTWRCTIFSRSYLADPFNDGEVNPPEATVSFSSLLKGHWTPELLKTVQSKEMPNLSLVHSAAQSVFMNELYTTERSNSQNWLKGVEEFLCITALILIWYCFYNKISFTGLHVNGFAMVKFPVRRNVFIVF